MDELQPRRGPGRPPKYIEATPPSALASVEVPRERPKRRPFGTMEQKLAYPVREGYHRHWFNDIKDRISRAQEAGYSHVIGKEDKPVKECVGVAEQGGPLYAFLMEIPQEWYDEDMRAHEAEIAARESGMRRGQVENAGQDANKFYAGKEGISIKKG